MSVLLPHPFSPARQWTSPGLTSKDTPFSARTPPKVTLMFLSESSGSTLMEYPPVQPLLQRSAPGFALSVRRSRGICPRDPRAWVPGGLKAHANELVDAVLVD